MSKHASRYRMMNKHELCVELEQLRREQLSLALQACSGQLSKWHLVKNARRNIARIKTALRNAE